MRRLVKQALQRYPQGSGLFRRHIWSRIHFPEAELRLLSSLPSNSFDCVVDVGAALGSYSWILSRKARRVIAYEPGQANGDFLEVATRNGNIRLVRGAVGAEAGELELFTGNDAGAVFTATLSRQNPVAHSAGVARRMVPVFALDSDIVRHIDPKSHVDLIKIDVEGYENAVIAGALETIARHHPIIICEIEVRHNTEYGYVFDTMRDAGYEVHCWRQGQWFVWTGNDISALQDPRDFSLRLQAGKAAQQNSYINNFLFQHPQSRVKIVPS